jgi:hypothetical protein
MSRLDPKTGESLKRIHIWLSASDIERLHDLFDRTLGFSRAIRVILRKALSEIAVKADAHARPIPVTEAELDLGLGPEGGA